MLKRRSANETAFRRESGDCLQIPQKHAELPTKGANSLRLKALTKSVRRHAGRVSIRPMSGRKSGASSFNSFHPFRVFAFRQLLLVELKPMQWPAFRQCCLEAAATPSSADACL